MGQGQRCRQRWCAQPVYPQLRKNRHPAQGVSKQPYAIALADHGIMALAGLWENWHSPAGEWIRTFAIITTQPNELRAEFHNRKPAVLKPELWPTWLGEQPATVRSQSDAADPLPF
jgi:putative SOS response-associated peptidase YedK